jgi:hypothetical protein
MTRILWGTLAFALSTAGSALLPAAPQDLAADMAVTEGGQTLETMKLYLSTQKTRLETSLMGGSVSIVRRDLGVVWVLLPARRQYTERPLDATLAGRDPAADPPGMVARRRVGTDRVSGYDCTRYVMTLAGPAGRSSEATACFADALGVYVRSEIMGLTSELRNIRPGPQPAHLFEIPAGWQKTTGPAPPSVRMPSHLPPGMAERMKQAVEKGAAAPPGSAYLGTLPSWVPVMKGCTLRGSGNDQAGAAAMTCAGTPEEVAAFIEAGLNRRSIPMRRNPAAAVAGRSLITMHSTTKSPRVSVHVSRNARGETVAQIDWGPGR